MVASSFGFLPDYHGTVGIVPHRFHDITGNPKSRIVPIQTEVGRYFYILRRDYRSGRLKGSDYHFKIPGNSENNTEKMEGRPKKDKGVKSEQAKGGF